MTALTSRAVISSNRLFSALDQSMLDQIASLATRSDKRKGTVLFAQGDIGNRLYGIISGRVRVSAANDDGREIHIVELGAGDTFGEIALLDGGPRTASAVVVESASVFSIQRDAFLALLRKEPELSLRLMQRLCERLRWTSELVEDLSLLDVEAQIARRLWLLLDSFGEDLAGGRSLKMPQSEIATFLGLSRQTVNVHLQSWKAEGWLELARGKIVILDMHRLQAMFESGEGR